MMAGTEDIPQDAHMRGFFEGEEHERWRVDPKPWGPEKSMNAAVSDMFTAIERFRRSGASDETCMALKRVTQMEWDLWGVEHHLGKDVWKAMNEPEVLE